MNALSTEISYQGSPSHSASYNLLWVISVPSEIKAQGKAKCSKSEVVKEFKAHQYLPNGILAIRHPPKKFIPLNHHYFQMTKSTVFSETGFPTCRCLYIHQKPTWLNIKTVKVKTYMY